MTPPTSAPDGGSSQSMTSTDHVVGLPTSPLTVLPGDDLTPYILPTDNTTDDNNNSERSNKKRRLMMPPKLGFGLHLVEHKQSVDTDSEEKKSRMKIRVTHAGQLVNPLTKNSKNNTWFVRHSTQRFSHPMVGDLVVGVVEEKVSADYTESTLEHLMGPFCIIWNLMVPPNGTNPNCPRGTSCMLVSCKCLPLWIPS
jgi:hypothetical protein